MTKVAVTYPDPEVAMVDLVKELLEDQGETATVAVGVPTDWDPEDVDQVNHVQVNWDGTPRLQHPIAIDPTIRIVTWSITASEAKRLALLVHGLILAHDGTGDIKATKPLVGPQPDRDTENRADLAWFTVRATVRAEPITPGS